MTIKHIRPTASFAKLVKTVRFICSLVGADVSTENYQVNIITIIVIICIIMYFIFTATTVASVFEENWTYLLEASCMVGSVLQGITKLISGISRTNDVSGMRLELEELYRVYESKGESYCKIMNACCDRVWQIIKIVGLIYGAAIVGNLLLTSFMVFFANQKIYIMHFFIPGVDVETSFGYLLTTALHSLCFLAGAFGLFGGDLFFLIYLGQPELFRDILTLKVRELNEAAAQKDNKTESLLISIIEWHQYYTDYNERCNEIFYYIITMQILTSGVSIVFTMYIILMGDWPGAYLYILIALSGLYLYCIIGTNIQTCNATFFEELYNINWYELDVKGRKMMILVLMKSQNPSEIKIAGVLPLSVKTALQITKTIYGIFTMMLQFLDEEE